MRNTMLILGCLWGWLAVAACPPAIPPAENPSETAIDASSESVAELATEATTPEPAPNDVSEPVNRPDKAIETTPEAAPEPRPPSEPRPEPTPEPRADAVPEKGPSTWPCDLSLTGKVDAGKVAWGSKSYVQYIAGNGPIIISAPHGGPLKPSEIPDRTQGTVINDSNSMETALEAAHTIYRMTGLIPHVIINRLHRSKLDANREIKEAAQGNQRAEQAWREFQGYIDDARAHVTKGCKRGHYFDFHTNAHTAQWTEFGYLLSRTNLKLPDATLNQAQYRDRSSLKALATWSGTPLSVLIRGPKSLGALLQQAGYKAVTSPQHPDPGSESYFSGGYNTVRHGSRDGGTIDGTQIETYTGFSRNSRSDYATKVAESIVSFMEAHYGFALRDPSWTPLPHTTCANAKQLAFDASGTIQLEGTTLGATNDIGDQRTCGKSFGLAGPQVYYRLPLKAGQRYEIAITPSFPARAVLFGSSCDVAASNSACASSGLNGQAISTNTTLKVTVTGAFDGDHILGVDSRNPAWYGPFEVVVKRLP